MLAQGLGVSIYISVAISAVIVLAFSIAIYFLIRWLGDLDNKGLRWFFSFLLACIVFYQAFFPPLVFDNAVASVAEPGVPSSRLIELVGPPHSIAHDSGAQSTWYYQTGFLADRLLGVHVDRTTGKILDCFVQ